jgi:predicted secreted acid phosphatase
MGSLFKKKDKKMKNNKKKAVLVDIDGTLVTLTDFDYSVFDKRDDETVEDKEVRVDEYLKMWDKNTLNASAYDGGIDMLKKFKEEGYVLVFLTARGQGCRKYTKMKLKEIGVLDMVDSMWHRPLRWESVSSSIYKEAMIKMLQKKWDFEYAMDDEEKNLVVMEKMGMKVIDARAWW